MPLPTLARYAAGVARGLAHLHAHGLSHNDLKPDNVLLDGAGAPLLADFGTSRVVEAVRGPGSRGSIGELGTWRYMAPESFFDAWCATGACDQFAMAVILHQCVTGRFPFEADGMRAQYEAILAGRRRPIEEGSVFDEVLRRALSPTPGERFPCMRAFGAALLPFASELVQARWRPVFPDAAPALEARATPVRTRPPWHITASAATLAVVCTAALVTPRAAARPSPPPTDATPPSAPVAAPHAPPLAPVAQTSATPTPPAASSSPPTSSDLAKTAPTPSVVHRRNALPHVPLVDALVAPSPAPPAGPRLVCDATGRCTVGRTL
jgi:serine/threonine-protein kinase